MANHKRLSFALLALALICTFAFDIFEFVQAYQMATDGAPWSLFYISLAESSVDIAVLVAVYWLMKTSLQRQEALSESKSDILSIVSHDLRSPIGTVLGLCQVLEESELQPHQRRLVERMMANGQHTLNLINDLLTQSALDGGGLKIRPRPVGVVTAVRDTLESQRPAALRKDIRLNLIPVEDDFRAEIDPLKFRQMLDNLISNAIKYSPSGKTVDVELRHWDKAFEVSVHDQGPGLTPAETKEVFGRFSKVKHRPTGGELSTGLGLSIARQMAELHGGELRAESQGPGHGSTFRLRLPIAPD